MGTILVNLGCQDMIPQTYCPATTETYLLMVWEERSPRSRFQPIYFMARTCFLACRWLPSSSVLVWTFLTAGFWKERQTNRETETGGGGCSLVSLCQDTGLVGSDPYIMI